MERGIAAEQLIPSEPRYGYFEAELFGRLGDKPRVDAINRRLVHNFHNSRQVGLEFALGDDPRGVLRAISARHLPRDGRLVVRLAPELLKGEGDGLYIILARVAHETD